jgi:outer membrane murein-binding lipoprotein Lpp
MERLKLVFKSFAVFAAVAVMALFSGCKNNSGNNSISNSGIDSLRNQIRELTKGNEMIAKNLVTFDTLDFKVFTNQQWTRLHESHSKDIKVIWPDGHFTTGIERHIADLKAMFVYAPNTSIKQHPIRFGANNMTCVVGVMTGTFTAPMPIGNGKFIQPTGKSFTLPMCTVGIWKDGVMIEEYLFWDNQTYMNQMGLGK